MTKSMSSYEERAWQKLIADERSRRGSLRARATDKVSGVVSGVVTSATDLVKKVPGGEKITDGADVAIKVALGAAAKAIFIPAIASVSLKRRTKRLRKRHPEIGHASPFEVLDLKALDKGRPRQIIPIAGAVGSAGASVAITGAEVSTAVSGGATVGIVAAAIAADIAASLGLLGRATAEVAVHYGFDPDEPGEEIFLMSVLSYSTASSLQGKLAALTELSKLSQQMMRRATWNQLNKDAVVKVIQAVFTKLGFKLTHKRLAQVVPVMGGLISAGLSYDMLSRALRDATHIYRVRYLSEKYGLSFDDWVKRAGENDAEDPDIANAPYEEPIDIEGEVAAAISEAQDSDSRKALEA